MKYLWELAVRAKKSKIGLESVTFVKAEQFSPYLEVSLEDLNEAHIPNLVEINPYYSFLSVFKDYFDPDYQSDVEIRHELFNLMIHFLAELDTHMGMTKREYELIFVIQDIEQGVYGDGLRSDFNLFDLLEKKVVAENLLRLHLLGEGVYLFQDTVRKLYKNATIYGNLTDKDVLMVHLLVEESRSHVERIQLLHQLFLPYHYEVEIYWIQLFGVIGVDESMKQEEIVMY